jgi:hypothetical protein
MKLLRKIFELLLFHENEKEEIRGLKKARHKQDSQLDCLTKATMDGDEKWMIRVVKRKNPTCALKILSECEDKENANFR